MNKSKCLSLKTVCVSLIWIACMTYISDNQTFILTVWPVSGPRDQIFRMPRPLSLSRLDEQLTVTLQTVTCACHTHHHLSAAAQSLAVVVRGNHVKFKVGASHVPVHDGRLNYACEGLNNKSVFTVSGRGDNQSVQHAAVIPCVLIQRLPHTTQHNTDVSKTPRTQREPQDT